MRKEQGDVEPRHEVEEEDTRDECVLGRDQVKEERADAGELTDDQQSGQCGRGDAGDDIAGHDSRPRRVVPSRDRNDGDGGAEQHGRKEQCGDE